MLCVPAVLREEGHVGPFPLLGSHVKHTVPDVFDVYLYELTNPHSSVGKELDYQPVTVPYLPVLVYITELKYLLNDPERAQRDQEDELLFSLTTLPMATRVCPPFCTPLFIEYGRSSDVRFLEILRFLRTCLMARGVFLDARSMIALMPQHGATLVSPVPVAGHLRDREIHL